MKSIKKLMLLSGILLSVSAFSFTFQNYKFQSPAVLTAIEENNTFMVNSSNEKVSKKINEKWTKFSIIFSFIFFIIILFCNRMTYIKGDYNGGSYRY